MNKDKVMWTTRINKRLKQAMVDYCDREGLNIEKVVEDAIINELEKRRSGKNERPLKHSYAK